MPAKTRRSEVDPLDVIRHSCGLEHSGQDSGGLCADCRTRYGRGLDGEPAP